MHNEPQAILKAGRVGVEATNAEFMSAMLGVLSTKVDLATWTECVGLARDCFRDRSKP